MEKSASQRTKRNGIYLLVLCIVLSIGGSLAYFYDDDSVRTMFTTGQLEAIQVRLIEPEWKSDEQGHNSLPGDNIPADPAIVNEEDPVYMRVRIVFRDMETREIINGARAEKIWQMIRYADETIDEEKNAAAYPMSEDEMKQKLPRQINESEFRYDAAAGDSSAGIYYFNYNSILDTGQCAVLYNYVIVPLDWSRHDIQEVGNFVVHIQGEAIHAQSYEKGKESKITSQEQAFRLLHEAMKEYE